MDLLDHLKEGLIEPDLLIDVNGADRHDGNGISTTSNEKTLRVRATTTLAELAKADLTNKLAPVLAQAAGSAASPQVRNVATAAGNLLQRPRCWYYRHSSFDCLKKGGYMCFAVEGENKFHAVFGDGPCHIVHPSNLAPALYVCNAVVHLNGSDRDSIPLTELYHLPDVGIRSEHNLQASEILTHITFDAIPISGFYAVKEKQSFDWPLAIAAVALNLDGDVIRQAKICAGAVAPVPWPLPHVAEALRGVDINDGEALRRACAGAVLGAQPMSDNGYKLKLLPVVVRRAILKAVGRETEA